MPDPGSADGQALVGFLSNEAWDALLADLDARIARLEALPDEATRREVFAVLDGIDAVHREALRRLVRLFKEGVLEQVITDPAIHTLLELYDLLPAAGAAPAPARTVIPIRAVPAAPPPLHPHWVPVLQAAELPGDGLRDDLVVDGRPLLVARHGEEWFAQDAVCPVDGASLRGARFGGYTLSCPAHAGCHYDVRSGQRVGGGAPLACHPVRLDDQGRLLVGFGVPFRPHLPSF